MVSLRQHRSVLLTMGAIAILFALGGASGPTAAPKCELCIHNRGVTFAGKALVPNMTRADIEAIFGAADRNAKLANTIHTWDTRGLYAYENKVGKIIGINFAIASEGLGPFYPKSPYKGVIDWNGVAIDARSNMNKLMGRLRLRSPAPIGWEGKAGARTVFIQAPNMDKTAGLAGFIAIDLE